MSTSPSPESVTVWVERLREGNRDGAQRLWEIYYERLVRLARKNLEGRVRLVANEEDVALSAFKSFWRGLQQGRFPQIADRTDLWNLLVTITLRKVLHLVRDESRDKRGGGQQRGDLDPQGDSDALLKLVSTEPTPEIAAQVAEDVEVLLSQLPSAEFVELALLKMEGYTNSEIAKRWNKAERTVERKLNLIRRVWAKHAV